MSLTPQAAVCIARDFAVKREEFSHMWHGRTDPLRGEELYSIVMKRNRSLAARQFTRQEFDKVLPHAAHQTNTSTHMHAGGDNRSPFSTLASPTNEHYTTYLCLALGNATEL